MRFALVFGCAAAAGLSILPASDAHAADTFYPAAPVPFLLTQNSYSQDFDSLAAAGMSSLLPLGWQVFEGGTRGNGTYTAGTGSSNSGDVYSFGAAGSAERALGSLGSGSLTPIYYGAVFTNGLGSAITGLTFGYTGEQWRAASGGNDRLTFQYSFDAPNVRDSGWTTLSSLNFASPNAGSAGAVNGNLAANQSALSGSLSGLSIADGATFAIRWFDDDTSGSDDGLAVDNFMLSAAAAPSAVPEPVTWAMMIAGFGLVGGTLRRRRARAGLAPAWSPASQLSFDPAFPETTMRLLSRLAILATALVSVPASAAEIVIDFDSLHTADGGYGRVYGPYIEDGFTLTASRCPASNNCFISPLKFQTIDPAGASILTQFADTTSTLTRNGGDLFSVASIDVAEYFDYGNFGSSADVLFSYVLADGSTRSETRTIDTVGRYPVNTLRLDTAPLRSFAFLPTRGTSGSLQFDNIVLDDLSVSAVPEPATWAMMIAGFGLVGGTLRRRRPRPTGSVPARG